MKKQLIAVIITLAAGSMCLLSCGQPSPPPPPGQTTAAHPAFLCVLCADDKHLDILDLEQRGKRVTSIPLPSTPGVMRVSPQAVNIGITDNSGVIRMAFSDLDHPHKINLDFAPTDIGFLTPQICLLSDAKDNQTVPMDIAKGRTIKPLATPAGPANYVIKNIKEDRFIYLACSKAKQLVEIDGRVQRVLRTLQLPGTPGEMLLDEITKNAIYMTLPEEGKLIRINLATFAVDATIDLVPGARYLCSDSVFSKLYISLPAAGKNSAGSIAVVKLPEFGRVLPDPISDSRLTNPGHLFVFDAIINSPVLYVCNPSSNYLALVDIKSYKVTKTIPTGKNPTWLGYIPAQENK
jgi:YVTN family beta-propeller protein